MAVIRSTPVLNAIVLLVLGGSSCSAVIEPGGSAAVVAAQGVRLTPQSIQFTGSGETRQLVVAIVPTNATDKAIVWESTDSSVATVSATGLVTAVGAGTAVLITAITHDGHHQSSVNVTVDP